MSGNDPKREERIRDYLDGRLTGGDLEAFELALFRDAALLDDVEATRALRIGLRELAARPPAPAATAAAAPAPQQPRYSARNWLPLAASFLLGAALPGYVLWQQARTPVESGKVQLMLVESVRGRPQTPTLPIDADAARVVLQFRAILTAEAVDFSLELRKGETLVQTVAGIVPDEEDKLSIDFPAARLPAGDYTAKITARLADGGTWDYAMVDFSLKK